MKRSSAKSIHPVILAITMILPLGVAAQTPRPVQPRIGIPRKLTLAQAEQLLLQRNLEILAARYQVDSFRAARLIASFKPNPVMTLGMEQIVFYSPLAGSYPRFFTTDGDAGAQPTYTLRVDKIWERGGKRELRTGLADYQLRAGEAQLLDAARTQLYQLRQAFTTAALARENLLLAETERQEYEQTVRLTEAKVENGDLARVELYRAQVAALPYQQAVQQARTSYQQAARDIINLLGARVEDVALARPASENNKTQMVKASFNHDKTGVDPNGGAPSGDAPIEIEFKFDDRPIIQTLAELRNIALIERPDVIAARRLSDAAMKGIALAQAQRTRDILIGSFYQRVGSDHSLGVNVAFPLLVYNKGYAAIAQAKAQQESAASLAREAELQALTDVEKAYLAYQSARRILDIYDATTLERASKLKNIAAFSYKEGATSLLELLDAERGYNQTVSSYNQARADYQSALWQLEQAIGRPLR